MNADQAWLAAAADAWANGGGDVGATLLGAALAFTAGVLGSLVGGATWITLAGAVLCGLPPGLVLGSLKLQGACMDGVAVWQARTLRVADSPYTPYAPARTFALAALAGAGVVLTIRLGGGAWLAAGVLTLALLLTRARAGTRIDHVRQLLFAAYVGAVGFGATSLYVLARRGLRAQAGQRPTLDRAAWHEAKMLGFGANAGALAGLFGVPATLPSTVLSAPGGTHALGTGLALLALQVLGSAAGARLVARPARTHTMRESFLPQ